MGNWTKLDHNIIHSTVWKRDNETKLVWISLLAMADKDGYVGASIPGLADVAGVSIEECEAVLEFLEKPDKYSRTPDNEGRRIEQTDRGWNILNYRKYRGETAEEKKRRWSRETSARARAKKKGVTVGDTNHCHALSRTVTVTEVTDIRSDQIRSDPFRAPTSPGCDQNSVESLGSSGEKESSSPLLSAVPKPVTDKTSISKSKKTKKKNKKNTPGSRVFDAYADTYEKVYGVCPVRNARVNTLCKQLVDLLGESTAVSVASYYPSARHSLYVNSGHALALLVRDAEKIRTEWLTKRQITQHESRKLDRRQTTKESLERYLKKKEEMEKRGEHGIPDNPFDSCDV